MSQSLILTLPFALLSSPALTLTPINLPSLCPPPPHTVPFLPLNKSKYLHLNYRCLVIVPLEWPQSKRDLAWKTSRIKSVISHTTAHRVSTRPPTPASASATPASNLHNWRRLGEGGGALLVWRRRAMNQWQRGRKIEPPCDWSRGVIRAAQFLR